MTSLDSAAEYDAARLSYPEGIYVILEEHCGGLASKVVGDGGAGTGVMARQLLSGTPMSSPSTPPLECCAWRRSPALVHSTSGALGASTSQEPLVHFRTSTLGDTSELGWLVADQPVPL